ncbi:MAG: hypothetical protein IK119_06350 [Bacteroidales bacterium]|nr:hypothetical protein [Bacteroidales bacterium]MBR3285145.1 hypothetical protein [Bacteroidales bacterium]MBR5431982.1 hypothetical protein [Bacteroidales bacterium]
MKAIFISYGQAYDQEIVQILEEAGQRGFTRWEDIGGRGTETGIPHYGNHTWPSMNNAILTIVEDSMVEPILEKVRLKDAEFQDIGLRAFVWNIEQTC